MDWTCQTKFSVINSPKNLNSKPYSISYLLSTKQGPQWCLLWWQCSDITHVTSVFTVRPFLQNRNSNCCIRIIILYWSFSCSLSPSAVLAPYQHTRQNALREKSEARHSCIKETEGAGPSIESWGPARKFAVNEDEYCRNGIITVCLC